MALITLAACLMSIRPAGAIQDITLQMQLGNLTGATADPTNHNHYLIQRTVEAYDYSDNHGQPNWASWDLTAADVGSSGRSDAWATDTNLPASFKVIPTSAYTGTSTDGQSYDRGHMCPSADRTDTLAHNKLVFIMSNLIPQASAQNQGIWANLEDYSRTLLSTQELLITCGPYGFGTNTVQHGLMTIPTNTFKVIVCAPLGSGTALSRITNANPASIRVIAVEIPNTAAVGSLDWTTFLTSTKKVQADTGLNFFGALPNNLAYVLRSKVDGQAAAAPGTPTFSPSAGISGDTITVTGTNLDSTTNVTFNGTSATFTITGTNTLTAIVPAGATSGHIVVKTLGGTGTSAASFSTVTSATPDLTISVDHTGNYAQGDPADTFTITITNIGLAASSGTVTVSNTLPAGLTATAMAGTGWTVNLGNHTATRSDALSANSTYPVITVTVGVATNTAASITNLAVVSGGSDTNTVNNSDTDVITVNAASAPTVTTAAASGVSFTSATLNGTVNPNNQAATAQFQYGLTTNYSSVVTIGTLTGSSAQAISTNITGLVNGTTYHYRAVGSNILGVTLGADQSFTCATPAPADLVVLKTHTGTFTQGDTGHTYTIIVSNMGGTLSSGGISVVDTLPTGLVATAISGTGWTTNLGTLTATRSDSLGIGAAFPAITVTVNVTSNAPALVTNTVAVSGGAETNTVNDTAADATTIIAASVPGVTTSAATGIGFTGATLNGTLDPNNQTAIAYFQYGPTTNYGFSATVSGTFTGTTAQAVSATISGLTNSTLYHFRAVGSNVLGVVTGGDLTFTTATPAATDLTIHKSHTDTFTQGDGSDDYTILVTNIGGTASSGTVTVIDTLPAGLTATAMAGTGWTINLGTLTATRTDALAGGAAYPLITVTVSVATNAPASVTNIATVSGGGDAGSGNNSASDVTSIGAFVGGTSSFAGTLFGWDVSTVPSGNTNFGVSPFPSTTNVAQLTVSGLTRAAGVGNTGSGAARGWGGNNFTNTTEAAAIAAGNYVTFTVSAATGYKVSYTNVSRLDYRRSSTGPASGELQYQIGSGAFVDIAALAFTVNTAGGGSIGAIDLSGVSALQNVPATTNVTFRIVSWGGTSSSGTWYIFDVANTTAADLSVDGVITAVNAAIAPSVTSQPQSLTNVVGTAASFSVSSSGTAPLSYRWLKNSSTIAGATNSTLSFPGVATNDAANYLVIITNSAGSVTSSIASLTVLVPPSTSAPGSLTKIVGDTASFSVTATGTAPLTYQWLKSTSPITDETNTSLTLLNVQTNDAASYQVIVANAAGSVTSSVATLTVLVPPTVSAPGDLTKIVGDTALFSVTADGTAPLAYQWQKDGASLGGRTNSSLSLANVQIGDAGNYQIIVANSAGAVTSSVATLTILVPPTVSNPASSTNFVGDTLLFSVTAGGTAPLTYQWLKNGAAIDGATDGSLSFDALESDDAGAYRVVVANAAGSVTSSVATLTVVALPSINTDPVGLTNTVGTPAEFTVAADGTGPLTYQWLKDGNVLTNNANVTGATSNVLDFAAVSTNDAADYSVVVANAYGLVTSAVANLTVTSAPIITTQPASQTNYVSATVSFNVVAMGTDPLAYQWLKNGAAISGATSNNFTLVNAQTNDAGNYTVIITNAAGAVTSSVAVLTLQQSSLPVITAQPGSQSGAFGSSVTFTVGASSTSPISYQWYKNGVALVDAGNISGSGSLLLTVSAVQSTDAGSYTVVLGNFSGFVTSSVATLTYDNIRPTLTISSPANNSTVTASVINLTGTAKDDQDVLYVSVQLSNTNGAVTTSTTLSASNATSVTWSGALSLAPGSNSVTVTAHDRAANFVSLTRTYFYNALSVLTVQTAGIGTGTLSPNRNGTTLIIGRTYTMTATAASGNVFSNWVAIASGTTNVLTENNLLTFQMKTNLILIATFDTNRFLPASGNYRGLFSDASNGVAFTSAGLLSVTISKPANKVPAFTGTLKVNGNSFAASGTFDVHGDAKSTKAIARKGKGSLTVRLHMPLDGSGTISGSVSNDNIFAGQPVSGDTAWSSTYRANRLVFNALTNPATAFATNFTMVIPGSSDPAEPQGSGYGYARVATSGNVTLTGALGDGSTLSAQNGAISTKGEWAFYATAYNAPHAYTNGASVFVNTEPHGMVFGWLTVTNTGSGISGTLDWIKSPVSTDVLYPDGFAVEGDILGSLYSVPATGIRAVTITNGFVQLTAGNLSASISNNVVLSTANMFTFPVNPAKMMLSVSKNSGLLTGSFLNADNTNIKTTFKGILLQGQGLGLGYFKGTSQSGEFLLQGN